MIFNRIELSYWLSSIILFLLLVMRSQMANQFHVRLNILNTVHKTWFTLRKFSFAQKLRNIEKTFVVGIWKHGNLISMEWNGTALGGKSFNN